MLQSDHNSTGEGVSSREAQYEASDVGPVPVLWHALALLVSLTLVLVGTLVVYKHFSAVRPEVVHVAKSDPNSAGSPQSSSEVNELARVHQRDAALLSTYGWVDRQAGIVRIPIDRAMEILSQRGLPSSPGSSSDPARSAANKPVRP